MGFENPLKDPKGALMINCYSAEIFILIILSLEAFFKIVAKGFIFNGKESYFKDEWNKVDFCLLVFSFFALSSASFSIFFKYMRLLRPLKIISLNNSLKIPIQSLLMAIPSIVNV